MDSRIKRFRVRGLGFRVRGLGFRVRGLGFIGLGKHPRLPTPSHKPEA